MRFGVFYELQLPKPWNEGDEHRVFREARDQIEQGPGYLEPLGVTRLTLISWPLESNT